MTVIRISMNSNFLLFLGDSEDIFMHLPIPYETISLFVHLTFIAMLERLKKILPRVPRFVKMCMRNFL